MVDECSRIGQVASPFYDTCFFASYNVDEVTLFFVGRRTDKTSTRTEKKPQS